MWLCTVSPSNTKRNQKKKNVSEDYPSNILTTHISAVEKNGNRTVKMFKENHHHKNKKQMLYIQLLLYDRSFS